MARFTSAPLFAACSVLACQGASSSLGLDAMLRVEGAQVQPGHISDAPENQAKAQVSGITTASNQIFPGLQGRGVSGKVGPDANAVAIGLQNDDVYWILPAGIRDATRADLLSFSARLDFSPELAGSPVVEQDQNGKPVVPVTFRAVTLDGRLGPSINLGMRLLDTTPTGSLVISLRWSAPVDLDLRVLAPSPDGTGTVEIWSKHASSLPRNTGSGTPTTSLGTVGTLDFDSNAGCVIDGRNQENVVWQGLPPAGTYTVRVDAFSLCGQASADWEAQASFQGQTLTTSDGIPADVFGIATDAATRNDHGAGAGIRAFDFDLQFQPQ
jgi:hypothetical protein